MNKKLFLGALLLGALTLNSCVDDKESASVTAIRQAKSEQLKAIADYNNAEAQANAIIANAEAQANQAYAEYKKAEAALREAEAAYEAALTEKEKQDAQEDAQRHANEMKQAEYDLQVAAAQLEVQLMEKKAELVNAETAYKQALKDSEPDVAAELEALLTAYQSESQALIRAKYDLAKAKIDLEGVKAGIVSKKTALEDAIAANNEDIAEAQTNLDEANAKLATYDNYTTLAEAQEAIGGVEDEYKQLYKDYVNANAIQNKDWTAYNNASNAFGNSAYVQAISRFQYKWVQDVYFTRNWDYVNGRPSENYGKWCASYTDENGKMQYIALFTDIESEQQSINYTYTEGGRVQTENYNTYTAYYDLVDGGFDACFKIIEDMIAANQGKALTDAQKAYTDAQAAQTAAATAVTTAETKLADAKKALEAAADVDKAEAQAAVDAAQNDLDAKKAALDQAETAVDQALTAQNNAEDALESANNTLDTYKGYYKTIADNAANNAANIKAYNEASKTYAEAIVATYKANDAYAVKYNEYVALNNIISNYGSISSYIAEVKNDIANYESEIERLTEDNADIEKQIADLENDPDSAASIEILEDQIAEQEAAVDVLQKKVDIAKKALDDAMAEEAAE